MKGWLTAVAFLALAALPASGRRALTASDKEPRVGLDPGLPPYRPLSAVSGRIRSAGTEHIETLMTLWVRAFTRFHPKTQFSVEFKASSTATPALTEGRADIGPVDRELLPAEVAAFEDKYGHRPLVIRVAGGSWRTRGMTHALAIFVNKANPIERLSLDELDAIYSRTRKAGARGDIRVWGQLGLGGEWADRPITIYGFKAPTGITNFLLQRALLGGEFKDGIKVLEYKTAGFEGIVGAVGRDPAGIGYAGFGDVDANPDVKAVALAEREGGPYYDGSFENVASRRYPLVRFVYVILNRVPGTPIDPRAREFLRFILSREGQEAVREEGAYLPLSSEIVREERAKLD